MATKLYYYEGQTPRCSVAYNEYKEEIDEKDRKISELEYQISNLESELRIIKFEEIQKKERGE
jgi:hypothetical protein